MRQQYTDQNQETAADSIARVESPVDLETVKGIARDQTDVSAQKIEQLTSAVRRRKRSLSWLPLPTVTVFAILIAVRALLATDETGIRPVYWALLVAFLASNSCMMGLLFSGITRLKRAVVALGATDDVRAVGVMAESLSAGEPALSVAGSVLIRLLPDLSRERMEALSPVQREALRKGLLFASAPRMYTHYNPVLVIAILQALERCGDKSDLAVVELVARRKATTGEQESILAAAEKCRSAITARSIGDAGTRVVWMEDKQQNNSVTSLSSGAAESLSTRLRKLALLRRRNIGITAGSAVFGTALAFLSMSTLASGHRLDTFLIPGMLISLASMIFFSFSGTYAQRNLTNALIHSDDLRIIPPLIQASATVEISGTTAVMLLTRLLPRMRASDSQLLSSDDRTLLHTAIAKHARNTEFVLAAISALQQVGEAPSIPTVQRLAERSGRGSADPSVREAARECLQFLQQRAAMSEANHTLLRASSQSAAPTDTLLRAIGGSTPTASSELLRTTSEPIVYAQPEAEEEQQNVQAFAFLGA